MSTHTRARPGPRPRAPVTEYRMLSAPESPPTPPAGSSAPQRRRWDELWSHAIAGSWDAVTDGPSVAQLIRLEVGESRGELRSREVDQISRLRRQLLITPPARRLAGVAIPGDAHSSPDSTSGAAEPAEFDPYNPPGRKPLPAVEDLPDLEDFVLRRLVRDLEIHEFLAAEAERDGRPPRPPDRDGRPIGPVHYAARAELARRGSPTYKPNPERPL